MVCVESDPPSTSFKVHEGGAEVRQNVSRINDHAESLLAERSGVMHKHRWQNHKIGLDSARLGQNNFGRANAVVGHRERITLPGQAKSAPYQEVGLVKNQGGGREVGMGESAAPVTDFVADSRQRSGLDR